MHITNTCIYTYYTYYTRVTNTLACIHTIYILHTHTHSTLSLMGPWPHTVASVCLAWPQVTYLPFTEAFDQARAKNKLVHSILLWGALDDQSC